MISSVGLWGEESRALVGPYITQTTSSNTEKVRRVCIRNICQYGGSVRIIGRPPRFGPEGASLYRQRMLLLSRGDPAAARTTPLHRRPAAQSHLSRRDLPPGEIPSHRGDGLARERKPNLGGNVLGTPLDRVSALVTTMQYVTGVGIRSRTGKPPDTSGAHRPTPGLLPMRLAQSTISNLDQQIRKGRQSQRLSAQVNKSDQGAIRPGTAFRGWCGAQEAKRFGDRHFRIRDSRPRCLRFPSALATTASTPHPCVTLCTERPAVPIENQSQCVPLRGHCRRERPPPITS